MAKRDIVREDDKKRHNIKPDARTTPMQFIANTIISLGAITLLVVGVYQGVNDRTASSTSLLGFGFLLIVLLVLAKFKRFKGFGFEAEMWEEKQIEAAELVDRLSLLSESVAQQAGLIASKLGRWDAALSRPEMANLLDQTHKVLDAAGVSPGLRGEILAPLYLRVEQDYWWDAHRLIETALRERLSSARLAAPPGSSRDPAHAENTEAIQRIERDQQLLKDIPFQQFKLDGSITALITCCNTAESLNGDVPLRTELHEIDLDLKHFQKHHSIRRNVDRP